MTLWVTLVILVAFSAFFSASETAFSSLNQIRLKSRADDGDRTAARVLAMSEQYDKLLSTILIGNNIVNIAAASIGTIIFTKMLGAERGATVSTMVLTIVVLIFGEVTPKSLAKEMPETIATAVAPVLSLLMLVLTPLTWLFSQWKRLLNHFVHSSESDTVTDGDTETVTVDGADITATYGATYYTANGRCFYAPDGVYALDGEVVLPLADLEKIFGVTAAFSADNTSLRVDASEQALLESGESYYGARDVYWLSHIINAEAGNQPMDGQIAVGNVVLNRVADERFPNSVKEVVFDRRGGVAQFSPTADGRISLTPDEDAELAAKLAFEGYDPVGESLYFINPSACNASWFNSRLTYTATIGDHVFYA